VSTKKAISSIHAARHGTVRPSHCVHTAPVQLQKKASRTRWLLESWTWEDSIHIPSSTPHHPTPLSHERRRKSDRNPPGPSHSVPEPRDQAVTHVRTTHHSPTPTPTPTPTLQCIAFQRAKHSERPPLDTSLS
jgi:hypothetical protein